MNVRPDQLSATLTDKVFPLYFVCGDEPLQQMEAGDAIRRFLRTQDYIEREVLDIDANFDWQRFTDETATMSLFAQRRILELRLPSTKPGRQGGQIIKAYCQHPVEDIVVLVNAGRVDASTKKSAWFKAIEQSAMVVQCWQVKAEKLPAWVKQRFLQAGMQPDTDVVSYVCQHIEGNLLAAAQEIDKLLLLIGPGKIHYSDVAEAMTRQSRYSLFELMDMILKGNQPRVIRIVDGLKAEGMEPLLINSMLVKDIRLLAKAAEDISSADSLLRRSGIWASRAVLFKSCLQRHSARFFQAMIKRCARIDQASKGLVQANVWDEIMGMSFHIAGRSR